MFLPGRECDFQGDGLGDDRVGSAVEKLKGYWWNQICLEFVFSGEVSVDETVSWAGVEQSLKGVVGNIIRVKRYYEGVIWKSGHIEFNLISSMERVNAVLYLCGGRTTLYFFESVARVASDFSLVLAAWALAFEVEDMALEQSWAI